jgi:hypothetical protein
MDARCFDEGRRIAHRVDFPESPESDTPLLSDQSLGGHEDFPRDRPLPTAGGFPRYEPVLDRPSRGGGASVCAYPTRNFA